MIWLRNKQNLRLGFARDLQGRPPKINKMIATIDSFLLMILTSLFGWLYNRSEAEHLSGRFGVKLAIMLFIFGLSAAMVMILTGAFIKHDLS
ncbi:hypothetical protein Tco_1183264 [Tanacetum coccineum]